MPLYPSNTNRLDGFNPLRLSTHAGFQSLENSVNRRVSTYAGEWQAETSSHPNGAAPRLAMWLPLVSGGMSARSAASITGAANLLSGGPMSATFAADLTADTPSMSLITSMEASFAGSSDWDASLRLTIGMEATFTATFTGSSNLAMIVPMGNTTFTSGISGAADLKGYLSMSAEFGGAEPLSPAGLATAVWAEVLESGYSSADIMRIMAASLAGKTSGQPSAPVFRSIDDSADRITATVDDDGNRTAITLAP